MKRPTKFVKPLTEEQRKQLKEIMKSQAPQRRRIRAHAVLLSDRRYSINQIADIYQVERDRVSAWLDWWHESEFAGLDDDERGGRPRLLDEAETKQAVELVKEEPRQIKRALHKPSRGDGETRQRSDVEGLDARSGVCVEAGAAQCQAAA